MTTAGELPALRVALLVALPALVLPLALQAGACSRHVELRADPDGSLLTGDPTLDAGTIADLDSGLGTDAFPPCATRSDNECYGTSDFPCAFSEWAERTALECQRATDCVTNGYLHVTLDDEGCVSAIGMTEPNDAMVACLLGVFGTQRCACGASDMTQFFGLTNTGTCPDGGGPGG